MALIAVVWMVATAVAVLGVRHIVEMLWRTQQRHVGWVRTGWERSLPEGGRRSIERAARAGWIRFRLWQLDIDVAPRRPH